ncbi:phosphoserine phosphatase, chloroplastic [Physcomitrium patens]|uniref:phosphoserine phosphatase n=1 Tax=Physcomitrium patens TaxID=3218 RepID=A0A2K1K7L5_PHYPA|nr:phosphoserine phosphatase, chloroplastic-like [Physcomitrium patens]PNR49773.1 hypothetical protein PHYPA_011669 [Physcomitrium patens]|eukprot:XP_024381742.1 phosphoserine phosphatase, chloroplastic-like [Physcomitrella patens]
MEALRSRLMSSTPQGLSTRGCDAAVVPLQRSVRLVASRSRTSRLSPFASVSCGSGVPSSRKISGLAMAMQAGPGENATFSTSSTADVVATWRSAQAVCFDVDSTVCEDEGIDELAAFCGAGEAVAAWTARAMGGSVPFEDALAARLALFRPSVQTLAKFLDTRPPRLSQGIRELVSKLHSRGTDVFLVSGGFRQMIAPVAAQLHIPSDNVFANSLLFGDDGEYTGFDATEPTSRSGGKAQAIEQIKKEHGYQTLVMIGDGATDLEARRPGGADLFICYGGVVARHSVVAGADWFVTSFQDLIESLN